MRWVLLGPPGSGKGTQAKKLAAAHGATHLSTGDILRDEIARGTKLGLDAKTYMDRGDLVPDAVILGMIRDHLPSGSSDDGFILDGFPRTEAQARELDTMLRKLGVPLDRVVLVTVGDDEIKKRLKGRAALEGRADDTVEVINRRLNVYRSQTEPVVKYYRRDGRLTEIKGEQPIDRVYRDLEALVD